MPYGKDNAGDEAILAATISLIRTAGNDPEIIVSTGDGEATRKKFNVKTMPLLGFLFPKRGLFGFIKVIARSKYFAGRYQSCACLHFP